ncbi:hypothetical protein MXD62_27675, partial [Frankia sp. Mgl5]|uniref:hypothetical protein n=1 Tax=Frankia sp. Mgl5 TaxID=2933793 RepID=UPI00200C40D6
GRLDIEHDFRDATKTLPERRVGTDDGHCAGYVEASVEERPPPSVLRGRLEAVLALHPTYEAVGGDLCRCCGAPAPCPTVRAARGETR